MATKNHEFNVRVQTKRDTSSNWTSLNPVLLNGEIIIVDTAEGDVRLKIGDGTSVYTALPFLDEYLDLNTFAKTDDVYDLVEQLITNELGDYVLTNSEAHLQKVFFPNDALISWDANKDGIQMTAPGKNAYVRVSDSLAKLQYNESTSLLFGEYGITLASPSTITLKGDSIELQSASGNQVASIENASVDFRQAQVYVNPASNSNSPVTLDQVSGLISNGSVSHAESADSASEAAYATEAGQANEANHAISADSADSATHATSATNATNATKASRLSNTAAIGSATLPVYFDANGVPVACNTSLAVSVTGSSASCTGNAATATSATSATNATNATNIYSSASTSKAYILGTTTASSANHATVYNASVYTSGSVLYGAAWNDYAEYRIADCYEPGRVICENGDDTLSLSTERLQPGDNVISDTFGFAIGETEMAKTPIAVSGRVLVYTYEDRDSYAPGDAVCAAPNGTVSKMTREEIREYPERIIGTVSAVPNYDVWGENQVHVNGRIWIKV